MSGKRKVVAINKGRGRERYYVDIPRIDVRGNDYQDCIDSVVEYVRKHADLLFTEDSESERRNKEFRYERSGPIIRHNGPFDTTIIIPGDPLKYEDADKDVRFPFDCPADPFWTAEGLLKTIYRWACILKDGYNPPARWVLRCSDCVHHGQCNREKNSKFPDTGNCPGCPMEVEYDIYDAAKRLHDVRVRYANKKQK